MPSIAIVGLQWGDEGKAKIVDFLAKDADAVVRTSGGNNAGHTVVVDGVRYRFNTVPCGILHENVFGIIGNGTAINPPELIAEIESLKEKGLPTEHIYISSRAHVVLPYHVILDGLMDESRENEKGDPASARRGIRPCYMDKYQRIGIRVCDMLNPDVFARKVRANVKEKNRMITKVYGGIQQVNADQIIEEYNEYAKLLAPYVTQTGSMLADMIDQNKRIIFEGAQATLLDPDYGTYPYVTSSHPTIGGIFCGSGLGLNRLNDGLGVMKAYTTRAGRGPFPTELFGKEADALRVAGNEYETSGTYRRVGWFDVLSVRYALRINGLNSVAITKLNEMSYLDEVKICVGYRINGQDISTFPADTDELMDAEPIYETMPGWGSLDGCASYEDLPAECKAYVERIESLLGAQAVVLELGAGRNRIIAREDRCPWIRDH